MMRKLYDDVSAPDLMAVMSLNGSLLGCVPRRHVNRFVHDTPLITSSNTDCHCLMFAGHELRGHTSEAHATELQRWQEQSTATDRALLDSTNTLQESASQAKQQAAAGQYATRHPPLGLDLQQFDLMCPCQSGWSKSAVLHVYCLQSISALHGVECYLLRQHAIKVSRACECVPIRSSAHTVMLAVQLSSEVESTLQCKSA